jgi:DNA-binding NarL/FixJ family response regulator
MPSDWPLVGREAQIRRVSKLALELGRGIVFAGPAGAGKSSLGRASLKWAQENHLVTAEVVATRSASAIPFGAWAPLLPNAEEQDSRAIGSLARFLRSAEAAVVQRAGGGRLFLFVDDAHLLDEGSAVLLRQLATDRRVFLVVAVRTSEPAPEPVVALWKDELIERVDLEPLDEGHIEVLLRSVLAGPVESGTVARFASYSAGNALFLRELIGGALHDRTLRLDGDIWRLMGTLSPSSRLVELVEARLGRRTAEERALLEILSYGEPLGPFEIEKLADPATVQVLERDGILSSRRNGLRLEIRFAHPIYREVIHAQVPGMQARTIARKLAEVVESTGARRREDALRIATWRLDGGGGHPDVMLAAAVTARWRFDLVLAARLAAAAIGAGAGFDARLFAAQLDALQGRGAEAETKFAALAGQATDDTQRAIVAVARIDNQAFWLGRLTEGMRIANEAEAQITDPKLRDEIAAVRCGIVNGTAGPRGGSEAFEPLLARASGPALALGCAFGAFAFARFGRHKDALEASELGHDAQIALGRSSKWDPSVYIMLGCKTRAQLGQFEEAERIATTEYRRAVADGNAEAQAWLAWHLGESASERGNVTASVQYEREAIALFRQLGRPQMVMVCTPLLVIALALGNQVAEATKTLAWADDQDFEENLYWAVDLLRARAWTAVAAGDIGQGCAYLNEAVTVGTRCGDLVATAAALHDLARLGHSSRVISQLSQLESHIEGELVRARSSHVRALASNDVEGLEDVAVAFESMGAFLLARDALADASAAWRQSGEGKLAVIATRRMKLLARRCEGAVTPAFNSAEALSRLTQAELEVARSAAAGSSSKTIAENSCRSVRTVENLLQRAYEKLGISSRAQVADALSDMRRDPSTGPI